MTLVQTASAVTNFTCQCSGVPRPLLIIWQHVTNKTINITPDGGQYHINADVIDAFTIISTLTISSVTLSNAGVYLCLCNNGGPLAVGQGLLSVIGEDWFVQHKLVHALQ